MFVPRGENQWSEEREREIKYSKAVRVWRSRARATSPIYPRSTDNLQSGVQCREESVLGWLESELFSRPRGESTDLGRYTTLTRAGRICFACERASARGESFFMFPPIHSRVFSVRFEYT